MRRLLFVFSSIILSWCLLAHGYEIETHGAITQETYTRSILSTSSLLDELSLEGDIEAFGNTTIYYDVSGSEVSQRSARDYEGDKIKELGSPKFSIKGWLMRGAIREDDVTPDGPCNTVTEIPQDDDYPNPPDRPVNHFYDPVNDRALEPGFQAARRPRTGGWVSMIPLSENTWGQSKNSIPN